MTRHRSAFAKQLLAAAAVGAAIGALAGLVFGWLDVPSTSTTASAVTGITTGVVAVLFLRRTPREGSPESS